MAGRRLCRDLLFVVLLCAGSGTGAEVNEVAVTPTLNLNSVNDVTTPGDIITTAPSKAAVSKRSASGNENYFYGFLSSLHVNNHRRCCHNYRRQFSIFYT